jgi:hypothetical protein
VRLLRGWRHRLAIVCGVVVTLGSLPAAPTARAAGGPLVGLAGGSLDSSAGGSLDSSAGGSLAGGSLAGGQGSPLRVEPLPAALRLAGAGPAWRLTYVSTSWSGRRTAVTGTVTLPPGRPPSGGWPVVSFGHGMGGTGDACAPSHTGPSPWERAVQETLLAAGYAVAVADYEGIGTPAESPVIDGRAEAYGMVDVVRAARRLAPVSRSWVAVGYSLGGHAALFAGRYAPGYARELRLVGVIGMAPLTQLGLLFGSPSARDPAAPANPTVPYSGRSVALTSRGAFRPADWFTPAGLALVDLAGHACIEEMAARMAGLTTGDVFRDPAAAADAFLSHLADEEIPVGRYRQPVRLVHGSADTLPAVLTEITAGQLAAAGTDVRYTLVPGADHFTLLPAIAADVLAWTRELFARDRA